jgi:hypothetical protein
MGLATLGAGASCLVSRLPRWSSGNQSRAELARNRPIPRPRPREGFSNDEDGRLPMDAPAIALAITDSWNPPSSSPGRTCSEATLPGRAVLEELLASAFEESLLREENRSLNFRLILRDPDRFVATGGPPAGGSSAPLR